MNDSRNEPVRNPDELRRSAFEEAAKVAERDVDWTVFGKRDLEQWEGGPDSHRDYRLGVRVGRAIAAAIRAIANTPPPQPRERVSDTPSAALEASHE